MATVSHDGRGDGESQCVWNALHLAILCGREAVAVNLLDRGTDLEARNHVRWGRHTERISEAAWAA